MIFSSTSEKKQLNSPVLIFNITQVKYKLSLHVQIEFDDC